jgi:hypothetical protein
VPSVEPGRVRCCSSTAAVKVFAEANWLEEPPVSVTLAMAEIENLGVRAFGDEDVRRLDVAVNDSLGMSCIQGIGDLDSE